MCKLNVSRVHCAHIHSPREQLDSGTFLAEAEIRPMQEFHIEANWWVRKALRTTCEPASLPALLVRKNFYVDIPTRPGRQSPRGRGYSGVSTPEPPTTLRLPATSESVAFAPGVRTPTGSYCRSMAGRHATGDASRPGEALPARWQRAMGSGSKVSLVGKILAGNSCPSFLPAASPRGGERHWGEWATVRGATYRRFPVGSGREAHS